MKVDELRSILGEENVQDNPEILQEYSEDYYFAPGPPPKCAVKPASLEELKEIIKWANENRAPIIPVSSGSPHFRGDTAPNIENSIIVDLRRMNKIIRINYDNKVALVEPGVTFGELQTELAKSGLSAYLPLCAKPSKSVLASVLERDPITMPCIHFDSTDPMLCAEIVFGTGDSMRTGEAAGPDTLEQQWEIGKAQISPFGPTQMDPQRLVSGAQGTMGIVTWMSLKCRFLSKTSSAFFVPSRTLDELVDLSYKLTNIRFSGHIFILNNLNLACLLRKSPSDITALKESLPPWVLFVTCEGFGPLPEEKVRYLEEDLRDITNSFGLRPDKEIGGASALDLAALLEVPSESPFWKQRLTKGFADLFFLTTQGETPKFAKIISDIAGQHGFPAESIGCYIQPVVMGTSCHCEFDFYFDPSKLEEIEKTRAMIIDVADQIEKQGAFFSRPYQPVVDIAYRQSGDTAKMQKNVRNIFDPNGIMNPGQLCFR